MNLFCPRCGSTAQIKLLPSNKHQPRIVSWDCGNAKCDQNPRGKLGQIVDKMATKVQDFFKRTINSNFKESTKCQKDPKSDS